MKIIYKLPEKFEDFYLKSSIYMVINEYYTATVTNLSCLISYLRTEDNISNDFGKIVKMSADENISDFMSCLNSIISEVRKAPVFNPYKHTFVDLTEQNETVTIKTKSGKFITVSCIGEQCADIVYHNSGLPNIDGIKQFNTMGFNLGSTPVKLTPVTISCILFD